MATVGNSNTSRKIGSLKPLSDNYRSALLKNTPSSADIVSISRFLERRTLQDGQGGPDEHHKNDFGNLCHGGVP